MSRTHKNPRKPTACTRPAARSPQHAPGARARAVPVNGSSTHPPHTAPPISSRMSDALALLGLFLGTLDPSVVHVLVKAGAHGAAAFQAISEHARRAAELAERAGPAQRARSARGAGCSRPHSRASRTTSTP